VALIDPKTAGSLLGRLAAENRRTVRSFGGHWADAANRGLQVVEDQADDEGAQPNAVDTCSLSAEHRVVLGMARHPASGRMTEGYPLSVDDQALADGAREQARDDG
jgi:hypothetical protein